MPLIPAPSANGREPSPVAKRNRMMSPPGGPKDEPWDCTAWDLNTQQPHGGQDWSSIENFVEDFSVTTNFMGPPWTAIGAATASLQHLHHYPAANFEPALSDLAEFLAPGKGDTLKSRLLLGNGASELIDLVTRVGAHTGSFFVQDDQYKEYARAALAHGRSKVEDVNQKFSLTAVVNPCNPTGEYRTASQMMEYLEKTCQDHTTVLVDESMQPWVGPHWRDDSLVSQGAWVEKMCKERDVKVYVIHSWTKIWSCPGLRIGSIVAPMASDIVKFKEHQVPWSLNICALSFLSAAVKDVDYMEQTWAITPRWRKETVDGLTALFPSWEFHGGSGLSWIWIDTKSEELAQRCSKLAKAAGVPIRWGGLGYKKPEFIRVAVRSPHKQVILYRALKVASVVKNGADAP